MQEGLTILKIHHLFSIVSSTSIELQSHGSWMTRLRRHSLQGLVGWWESGNLMPIKISVDGLRSDVVRHHNLGKKLVSIKNACPETNHFAGQSIEGVDYDRAELNRI